MAVGTCCSALASPPARLSFPRFLSSDSSSVSQLPPWAILPFSLFRASLLSHLWGNSPESPSPPLPSRWSWMGFRTELPLNYRDLEVEPDFALLRDRALAFHHGSYYSASCFAQFWGCWGEQVELPLFSACQNKFIRRYYSKISTFSRNLSFKSFWGDYTIPILLSDHSFPKRGEGRQMWKSFQDLLSPWISPLGRQLERVSTLQYIFVFTFQTPLRKCKWSLVSWSLIHILAWSNHLPFSGTNFSSPKWEKYFHHRK